MKIPSFKKLFAVVLSALMLSSVFTLPLSVNAAQIPDDSGISVSVNDTFTDENGIVYTFTNNSGVKNKKSAWIITGHNGTTSDLKYIYWNKNGYDTIIIGESAFRDNLVLNTMDVPNSIYRIDDYAFYGCSNLTLIRLERPYENDKLETIGKYAFAYCDSLKYTDLNKYTNIISEYAFLGCTNLEEVSSSTKSIGKGAFSGCEKLTEVSFSNSLTELGSYAFEDCESLSYIKIPSKVTNIKDGTFSGCTSLANIEIPNTVTSISDTAFEGCENLVIHGYAGSAAEVFANKNGFDFVEINNNPSDFTYTLLDNKTAQITGYTGNNTKITIPTSIDGHIVTSIGYQSFYNNTNIESVIIPNTITEIRMMAFANNTNLSSVKFGKNVKAIDKSVFKGCTKLSQISIPNDRIDIATGSFSDTAYYKDSNNWTDGGFYVGRHLVEIKDKSVKTFKIKSSTISISSDVFRNSSYLSEIEIPNRVQKIKSNTFSDCVNLSKVTIINGVKVIGDEAFKNCKSLNEIIIPDSVYKINDSAFEGCKNLVKAKLSNNLSVISKYLFKNCSSLNDISIPDGVKTINKLAFENCIGLTQITIPVTEIGNYAFMNCSNLTQITIPDSVTEIGSYAFINCTSLAQIIIPNSVTEIGTSAFANCTSLAQFTLSYSVTKIRASVFANCTSLAQIIIPNSVTEIGASAFANCTSLAQITIPNSVIKIGNSTFTNCSALIQVTIPNSVTEIGISAFKDCTNLMNITFSNQIKRISYGLFNNCINLSAFSIPYSVTVIEPYAFLNCKSLTKITVPKTVSSIGVCALGYSDTSTKLEDFAIYGYQLTAAEKYTIDYQIKFVDLEPGVIKNLSYTVLPNGTVKITDYTGIKTILDIPDTLNGHKVVAIGQYAFNCCSNIEEVTIPDSVKTIESNAFLNCTKLRKVHIPDSVTSIGYGAFLNCHALEDIEISDNLKALGSKCFISSVFYKNKNNWENGALYLENYLIAVDTTLAGNYSVKKGTKLIADSAFIDCKNLTDIVLPKSLKTIDNNAFKNCTSLKNITIPKNVTSISATAFTGCSNFTIYGSAGSFAETFANQNNIPFVNISGLSPVFEYNLLDNGTIAITKCISAEENLTVPEVLDGYTVTAIGDNAFTGNTDITTLSFADSITSIGEHSFKDCDELISVTIPKNITSIGYGAFYNCTELTDITLHDNINNLSANVFFNTGYYNNKNNWDNGVLYIDNYLIKADTTLEGKYSIKDGTKAIADSAFLNCENVVEINVPESVERIGNVSFKGCSNLEKITLPVSVTDIKPNAFANDAFLTIYGYAGSFAEKYANENGIEFVDITPVIYAIGDIDLDGDVTILDVTLMQRYCADDVVLNDTQLSVADVDKNDSIDINDATAIQRLLVE
ncbi:MAG: leucine-rich repeat protein [Ruminococcus sp.]|nr:leucine-rich repeat protein [Ruminococcus sp.]